MCPACIASVAWIAAGVSATGGLAALATVKLGGRSKAIDRINRIYRINAIQPSKHESPITTHDSRPY